MNEETGVVHIAASPIAVLGVQHCQRCGAVIIDRSQAAALAGTAARWFAPGALVRCGPGFQAVDHDAHEPTCDPDKLATSAAAEGK